MHHETPLPVVLVLGGGPDAERAVSLESAAAVASALREFGFEVVERTIDGMTADELRGMAGDVVAPILHGCFGEGGPLQDLLERDGRPYVGVGPRAARLAMDKVTSKAAASACGCAVTLTSVFDPNDPVCPFPLPVVIKPVREGSTIGLHVCTTQEAWREAHAQTARRGRPAMIEPYLAGREVTVGIVSGRALPIIEITAAGGLYDYAAKYERNDTQYVCSPDIPIVSAERCTRDALALASALGAMALCRVDFILTPDGTPWLLEINTMPGFTSHSLVPMAARAAGIEMPALCAQLVQDAADRKAGRAAAEGVCA